MVNRSLPRSRYRQLGWAACAAAAVGVLAGAGIGAAIDALDPRLPDIREISRFHRARTLTILAHNGEVIQQQGPITREKVPLGQMPPLLKQAFIAAEDRRFHQHHGVDPWGIARAIVSNVQQGAIREGASTITQQLARMVFLNQETTITRKISEALLALKLERQLSKEQILNHYLNNVYLGSNAYGVADAAWVYFSKRPEQLTLAEAALIAGLPPAPSLYSPLVEPELSLRQRNNVLHSMHKAGFISADQHQSASTLPLDLLSSQPKHFNSAAPYFTEWVERELPNVLNIDQIERGGLTIRTTLNLEWQQRARNVLRSNRPGTAIQGALVSMDPTTGQVRAMVGGQSFFSSQFNRATQALRSPGSTFKLFVYTAALREGLLPSDMFNDKPTCFKTYCPRNFSNKHYGPISMADALRRSVNTVAVLAMARIGFDPVIETAQALGIGRERELGRYWPMALGAYEQTVLEMTAAYSAVNNRGVYVAPTPFLSITGPDEEQLWTYEQNAERGRRAMDTDVADTMIWMLQKVVQPGGTGIAATLPDQRPVAGKTGTSESNRDLWFIGSIPQLTTGVWYGYDDDRDTRSTSGEAAWTWKEYMLPILGTVPAKTFPPLPEPVRRRMARRQDELRKQNRQNVKPLPAPPQPMVVGEPAGQSTPETDRDGAAQGNRDLPPSEWPRLQPLDRETGEFDLGDIPPFDG